MLDTQVNTATLALRTGRFLLGRKRHALSDDDALLLERSMGEVRQIPPRQRLVRRGQLINESTYLIEGFLCRYLDDRAGDRQLIAIHVPGDFVDLHAFPMKRLDHDIASLSTATVGIFDHDVLQQILEERPHLTRLLWFSTLLDAAMSREWIFRLGRLGAEGRIAHLLCELGARMAMVGFVEGDRFALPINQADIAEACGLTAVHVNRTLRQLRERGVVTFRNGEVVFDDYAKLRAIGEFNPAYLYPEHRDDWSKTHGRGIFTA